MGYNTASDLASGIAGLKLEQQITFQLRNNHFPPVPYEMIPVAIRAIELGQDEQWDEMVDLPEGVEHRRYGNQAPAHEIIRSLHLDPWLE